MTDVVLTEIDLDIENRLADHSFAIEWAKMQDERIKELEAALWPFAENYAGREYWLASGNAGGCNSPIITNDDLRRAAAALKSD